MSISLQQVEREVKQMEDRVTTLREEVFIDSSKAPLLQMAVDSLTKLLRSHCALLYEQFNREKEVEERRDIGMALSSYYARHHGLLRADSFEALGIKERWGEVEAEMEQINNVKRPCGVSDRYYIYLFPENNVNRAVGEYQDTADRMSH